MRISLTATINNTYKSTCHKAVQISSFALLLTATLAHAATDIPSKGMTQDQVRNNFGEPSETKAAVGQPPISRWDYQNYSVYFENNYVIHSFLHGQKLKPQLNPEASTGSATSQSDQNSEQGANQQEATSQPAQQMPTGQDSEPQVTEELDQTEQEQSNQEEQAKQEIEEPVAEEAQASQETEEPIEQEMQAAVSEEKDLNFEEDPQNADYGKWE